MKTLHGSGVSIILSHKKVCPKLGISSASPMISHVFATTKRHLNLAKQHVSAGIVTCCLAAQDRNRDERALAARSIL